MYILCKVLKFDSCIVCDKIFLEWPWPTEVNYFILYNKNLILIHYKFVSCRNSVFNLFKQNVFIKKRGKKGDWIYIYLHDLKFSIAIIKTVMKKLMKFVVLKKGTVFCMNCIFVWFV